MRTLRSTFELIFAAALFLLLGIRAAYAPGSISLDEVMAQLKDDTKLTAEVDAELKAQSLKPQDVICSGARFGNHWEHLGGARAIPFECQVGKRTLNIDGELHLYDKGGNEIDMGADTTPAAATSYKETDLRWEWH